jgi:hypothetical protein
MAWKIWLSRLASGHKASMNKNSLTCTNVKKLLTSSESTNALSTGSSLAPGGELPGFKVSNSWRFKQSELEQYIASQHNQCNVTVQNKFKGK